MDKKEIIAKAIAAGTIKVSVQAKTPHQKRLDSLEHSLRFKEIQKIRLSVEGVDVDKLDRLKPRSFDFIVGFLKKNLQTSSSFLEKMIDLLHEYRKYGECLNVAEATFMAFEYPSEVGCDHGMFVRFWSKIGKECNDFRPKFKSSPEKIERKLIHAEMLENSNVSVLSEEKWSKKRFQGVIHRKIGHT